MYRCIRNCRVWSGLCSFPVKRHPLRYQSTASSAKQLEAEEAFGEEHTTANIHIPNKSYKSNIDSSNIHSTITTSPKKLFGEKFLPKMNKFGQP